MNFRILAMAVLGLSFGANAQTSTVAARVEFTTGRVTLGNGETARALSAGDAVAEHDSIVTGPNSYANLRFADGGHILLRPSSEFVVESFRFAAPPVPDKKVDAPAVPSAAATAPAGSNAFFKLVRGGFRAISGLIGKNDKASYQVTTPAATIGIRGTDYEVAMCDSDCPREAGGQPGVIAATHDGSINLHTPRGDFTVDAGHVALALMNGQTFALPIIPDAMIQNPAPSPESCR